MITVNGYKLNPTVFPDGTSQVWKLPDGLHGDFWVDWRYESDNELIQLFQLRTLWPSNQWSLHIPFLPYARQDKEVKNDRSFGLRTFGQLINNLRCGRVSAVDVHNPEITSLVINNFVNIPVHHIHHRLIDMIKPDCLVFPDHGAMQRYSYLTQHPYILFDKKRNQATGDIMGHELRPGCSGKEFVHSALAKFLIIDDLCDGGRTFTSIAHMLESKRINLFVTHGLFSKGRGVLEQENIELLTTNSLAKNISGFEV